MSSSDRILLEIFSAEQAEHLQHMRLLLDALEGATPEERPGIFDELMRRAHTLKGASRAVGLGETESLTHRLEGLVVRLRDGGLQLVPEIRGLFHQAFDAAEDILASVLENRPRPARSGVLDKIDALLGAGPRVERARAADQEPGRNSPPPPPAPAASAQEAVASAPATAPSASELVRVNAHRLDELIRSASQVVAVANAGAATLAQVSGHAERLEETLTEWLRLRRDAAAFLRRNQNNTEFAPVAECLQFIDGRLPTLLREARAAVAAQQLHTRELHRQADELHDSACQARMTPAESAFGSFGAMVRNLAEEEGKQVEFRTEGMDLQADRLVLQALKDPVMHLLRNAVSHGIEPVRERAAANKPPEGSIRLRVQLRGDRLLITVQDDGRGINTKVLAEEAVKRGILSEPAVTAQSPDAIAQLIFQPGFSTSKVITSLSGRGMGLSVVQQTVNQLHGEIRVRPAAGGGTLISIMVPLSIATHHVLLMNAGGQTFGIPVAYVDRLLRVRREDIRSVEGRESVMVNLQPAPLARLTELLRIAVPAQGKEDDEPADNPVLPTAVLSLGEQKAAIVVDRLLDQREVVVKDLGLPREKSGLSAGAVPMEDGSVAILLNVADLLDRLDGAGQTAAPAFLAERPAKKTQRILVVDDSITTRSLEKSLLEAHGFEVEVAVDGMEALEKLRVRLPDLLITDVMMPRMTGFQLLEQMKSDKQLENVPVIMVTSLESREEQEKGLSLGADAYIVKRKFDQRELLQTVRQIL